MFFLSGCLRQVLLCIYIYIYKKVSVTKLIGFSVTLFQNLKTGMQTPYFDKREQKSYTSCDDLSLNF